MSVLVFVIRCHVCKNNYHFSRHELNPVWVIVVPWPFGELKSVSDVSSDVFQSSSGE